MIGGLSSDHAGILGIHTKSHLRPPGLKNRLHTRRVNEQFWTHNGYVLGDGREA